MDVRLPDGRIVRNVPAGTTKAQILQKVGKPAAAPASRGSLMSGYRGKSDLTKLYAQGGSFGLSDEIIGGAGALIDAIASPFSDNVDFNPVNSYTQWRDAARADVEATRKERPWSGAAIELVGGLGRPSALKGLAGARSVRQASKEGAKKGAAMGATAGFGYGEGVDGSLSGAGLGATFGGILGGSLPSIIRAVEKPARAAIDYFKPQAGIARELVSKALAASGITPRQAANALQEAQKRGVPLSLSDLSTNLRGLAAAVSRQPGAGREIATNAVSTRQAGQGERVRSALTRDLGAVANPFEVSDALATRARSQAAPLYEQAYSVPGRITPEIEQLLATPAGRQALNSARTIAANERRDPTALGFDLDDQGEVVLTRLPSAQTLDYVKGALDDMLEPYRDRFTGRLNLDRAGNAINDVRASLLKEMDGLFPDYAAARSAYAGPTASRAALDKGQKAIGASDIELERMLGNLGESEREHFGLGFRSALSQLLDKRVDGADKVGAMLGNPRKRNALAQIFGGEEGFDNFLATMADERAANETFRKVTGGSDTARFLADDAAIGDESLLADTAGAALRGAADDGWRGAVAELFKSAKDVGRFGAGKTGERARDEAASLLFESDPKALAESMRQAMRDQAARRLRARNVNSTGQEIGVRSGQAAGAITGQTVGSDDPYAASTPVTDAAGRVIGYVHPDGQLEVVVTGD